MCVEKYLAQCERWTTAGKTSQEQTTEERQPDEGEKCTYEKLIIDHHSHIQ